MPDRLGKYEIRGTLGKGAMGVVYDAWDPLIERRVAVKTIRLPAEGDENEAEEYARFKREAQAAGRLSHPGIVGVYDYGDTDGIAYIAMELVEGRSLKALMDAEHRLTPTDAVRVMRELLDALAYSHARGVIHRDIKPTNILVTPGGALKITDFGIARIESSSMTQMGTVMGTPAYMSPEQFMGQTVDQRTDIYAAGVLLFQLLTGERPFEGGLTAIMHKVLHTTPPKPSDLSVTAPEAFDAVVAKAMARRPEDRYASAEAFSAALAAALAGPAAAADHDSDATMVAPAPRPAPARPPAGAPAAAPAPARAPAPAPGHAAKKAGPPVAMLAGIAVAVLAAAGGGAFVLLRGGDTPEPTRPATQQTAQVTPPATSPAAAPAQPAPAPQQAAPQPAAPRPTIQAATAPAPAAPVPATPVPATPVPAAAPVASAAVPASPPPPVVAPAAPVASVPAAPVPTPPTAGTATAQLPATAPGPGPLASVVPPVLPPVLAPAQPPASGTPPAPPADSALAAALRDVACTVLDVGAGPDGRAVVGGWAGAGGPETAARNAAGAGGRSAPGWAAGRFEGPYCGVADTLRAIRNAQAAAPPGFDLGLRGGRTKLRKGEVMAPVVIAPAVPSYLQLLYFQSNRLVVHMFPTASMPDHALLPGVAVPLTDDKSGGWAVGDPFGADMMVAIMSSAPLPLRLEEEPSDTYLAALRRSAEQLIRDGGTVSARAIPIQTTR